MHDPKVALADKLTSQNGVNSFGRRQDAHERTQRCHGTNDDVENKFAIADFVSRTYRNIAVHNQAGIIEQRGTHDFDRPLNVLSDKRKRKATPEAEAEAEAARQRPQPGFFWRLSRELRHALVRMARRDNRAALATGRA